MRRAWGLVLTTALACGASDGTNAPPRGPLLVREMSVDGCLSTPQVEQGLAEAMEAALQCAPELATLPPEGQSALDSLVTISPAGRARLSLTQPARAPMKLAQCWRAALAATSFPPCAYGERTHVILPWVARTPPRGCLTKAQVQAVIQSSSERAAQCYEHALAHHPQLDGRIVIDFTIGPSGGVTRATLVEQALPSDQVGSCLMDLVRSLKFPTCPAGGAVQVRYPWVFPPAAEEAL